MFTTKNHAGDNKKAVFGSPIIAKAVIRLASGEYQTIVVFQKSTRLEFYWVFRAKSPRQSRRAWKYLTPFARDLNVSTKPYFDFQSFVKGYARTMNAEIVSLRVPHKRTMASLLTRTEHESIYSDWTPQNPLHSMSQELCRRRAQRSRDRQLAW
jgi:hypothetical protein